MTPPLIDYLVKFQDTHVTIASNLIEDAKKLSSKHPSFTSAHLLDIFNVSFSPIKHIFLLGIRTRQIGLRA
jgi:hypothetical protein